jgi:hypothetical protein
MLNVTSNTWFTTTLNQLRYLLASTSSTNKLFFGGGYSSSGPSDVVDIFDKFSLSLLFLSPLPSFVPQQVPNNSNPILQQMPISTLPPVNENETRIGIILGELKTPFIE